MNIKVEFSGGLELIFEKQKEITIKIEETKSKNFSIKDLILELKPLIKERPEFFLTVKDEV